MEMEYRDGSRRGRIIIILGVLLALIAGGTSFYLINQAQQQAGQGPLEKVAIVVAARDIAAHTPIQAADVEVRQVPLDEVTQVGAVTKPEDLIGAVLAIPVTAGQPIYVNMISNAAGGSGFSILGPNETVSPSSPDWRAVSISIPPERAVAGLLQVGQTVDILMTATLPVPASLTPEGVYIADASTKITYQNILILARVGDEYIFRCTLDVAEEIEHMTATGTVQFSAVLRPDQDTRFVDVSKLGATTNRILQKYGLPFPVVFLAPGATVPPQPPFETPTPPPTPGPTPLTSGSPVPSP
ncbi:MAG TPA: Flp pilus assembly protein CpaB [Candidatus Limnocylindrales bacterium]|nr:Flp pilus assembly protein CpaB [Candidatus Limnocylindrales bacterium]